MRKTGRILTRNKEQQIEANSAMTMKLLGPQIRCKSQAIVSYRRYKGWIMKLCSPCYLIVLRRLV